MLGRVFSFAILAFLVSQGGSPEPSIVNPMAIADEGQPVAEVEDVPPPPAPYGHVMTDCEGCGAQCIRRPRVSATYLLCILIC